MAMVSALEMDLELEPTEPTVVAAPRTATGEPCRVLLGLAIGLVPSVLLWAAIVWAVMAVSGHLG